MMDKAQSAYQKGEFAEAEAFAKRAQEIDPNEVAAVILAFKAKAERRWRVEMENKRLKEDAVVRSLPGIDEASIADPEVQLKGIKFPKNFKDLTRERLRTNAMLEPKKAPQTLAIEEQAQRSGLAQHGQAAVAGGDRLPPELHRDEHRPRSQGAERREHHLGHAGHPAANNIRLRTALKLLLNPLGLTYKIEDEVLLITSPQASMSSTISRPYYVGDLVMPMQHSGNPAAGLKNPTNPAFPSLNNPGQNPAQAAPMPNGMQSVSTGGTRPGGGPGAVVGDRPQVDLTPLISLITATIAPGTWRVHDTSGAETRRPTAWAAASAATPAASTPPSRSARSRRST